MGWSHPGPIRPAVWDVDGRAGDVSGSQMSVTELFTLLDFWFCFDLIATVPWLYPLGLRIKLIFYILRGPAVERL